MFKTPQEGGCWFCNTDDGKLLFDTEFDTYVHAECIRKALKENDPEAKIMSYLLEDET